MLARRTTTALVGLTVFTHAFQQLPRYALRRPTGRFAADGDDDDFDFEAACKARVEEVQSIDVVEAVLGTRGRLGSREGGGFRKGGRGSGGRGHRRRVPAPLLVPLLHAVESPLKEQPVENIDPGVCLSGKCANGAKNVKALEFTSDRFADDRNAARAENPEPFLE